MLSLARSKSVEMLAFPRSFSLASVAQSVEHVIRNDEVVSSILTAGSK